MMAQSVNAVVSETCHASVYLLSGTSDVIAPETTCMHVWLRCYCWTITLVLSMHFACASEEFLGCGRNARNVAKKVF